MNLIQETTDLQPVEDEISTSPNEIEGHEEDPSDGWGGYSIDSVLIRTEIRTVREIVNRIEKKRFILDPEFQRIFVWELELQSKLIESCLMRIPIPPIYLAEVENGRVMIVDGLQRLTTFQRFFDGDFALGFPSDKNSEDKNQLSGKKFNDLDIRLQERFEDTQITLYILEPEVPDHVRLDIFDRVNSGKKLSRQQMRNALFSGVATRWLKDAVKSSAFVTATNGNLDYKTMRDREAVNRFVSFTLCGWREYKGNMDVFLADGLRKLEKLSDDERSKLLKEFEESMLICYNVFGEHCFRKSFLTGGFKKTLINMSLFDVITYYFVKYIIKYKEYDNEYIKNNITLLLKDREFMNSITNSTNSRKAVQCRYEKLEKIFAPKPKDVV